MSESITVKMVRDGKYQDTVISNVCLICGKYENPSANIGNLSVPWLCDRCRRKLRAFVEMEEPE